MAKGVSRRKRTKHLSNKSIKIAASSSELAAAYNAGATIRELAAIHGCAFQNIHARLLNAGVKMRLVGQTKRGPADIRECPTCGKQFKAYSKTKRLCSSEHIRRVSVCTRGHILTEENRYHYPGSASRCKKCMHIRQKAYRARKKQAS